MQIGNATTWAEVVLAWLRSEGKALSLSYGDRKRLITNADLENEADNARRLDLLKHDLNRGVIIDRLPPNPTVRQVSVEASDLPSLYIVPTPDWYLDTGGTFLLAETETNLAPGRTIDFGNGPEPIGHYHKVIALQAILADYKHADATDYMLIIADNDDGPYIIIDGTHRATALYRNRIENKRDNMPWKGLLITHPQIGYSQWHVQSPVIGRLRVYWQRLIQQGHIK